jgi:hypothetical protein
LPLLLRRRGCGSQRRVVRSRCADLLQGAGGKPGKLHACALLEAICAAHQSAYRAALRHTRDGLALVELAQGLVGDGARTLDREERALVCALFGCLAALVQHTSTRRDSLDAGGLLSPALLLRIGGEA